jgi:hypothetical protein
MELLTTINEAYPRAAESLTLQTIVFSLGPEVSLVQEDEVFEYAAATMSGGIPLSHPVAVGTVPFVFLRGLCMVPGVDVQVVSTIDPVTLARTSMIQFIGTTYELVEDDVIHVSYYTPADDATAVFTATDVSETWTSGPTKIVTAANNAVESTFKVFLDGTELPTGWEVTTESREVGEVTVTVVTSVTLDTAPAAGEIAEIRYRSIAAL